MKEETGEGEAMDDASIAILLALGEQTIEWTEVGSWTYSSDVVTEGDGLRGRYEITTNHRGTRFYACLMYGGAVYQRNPATRATVDDAKAACERHYTTGEWE